MILAPPGHSKTTCLSVIYPLHRLLMDQNTRGALISKTQRLAEKPLFEIKQHIEQRYPWLYSKAKKWTGPALTVPRDKVMKDPTIQAVGLMGAFIGSRLDWAVCDDLLDDENTRTELQRDRAWDWLVKVFLERMEPVHQILITGYPWHYDDVVARVEKRLGWKVYKYPVIRSNGEALWEERFDIPKLEKIHTDLGTPIYNCQYKLDPSGLIGKLLKLAWLEPYYEILPADLEVTMGVDIAISEKEQADYTAIVPVGYSPSTRFMYIMNTYRGHLSFADAITKIVEHYNTWRPNRVIIETVAAHVSGVIYQYLKEKLVPVIPTKTHTDKVARINLISPFFEGKTLKVRSDMREFIDEYIQFPDGVHDDLLDATEFAVSDIIARKKLQASDEPIVFLGKAWNIGEGSFGAKGSRRLPKRNLEPDKKDDWEELE